MQDLFSPNTAGTLSLKNENCRPRLYLSATLVGLLSACAGNAPDVPRSQAAALSEPGDVTGSLARLGDFLNTRGDRGTAIALYQRAAQQSEDVVELVQIGRALRVAGAQADAIPILRRAVGMFPTNAYALSELGTALLAQGHMEESVGLLTEAARRQDEKLQPKRYRTLGVALELSGKHQEAREAYRKGLSIDPYDLDLTSNLGLSLALSKKHGEAVDLVEGVAKSSSATIKHHRNVVLVLALAGREKRAKAVGLALIGPEETVKLLDQAGAARKLKTHRERATAIGIAAK